MNMIMTCDICSIASILLAGGCTVLGIYVALLRDEIKEANAAAEHFEKRLKSEQTNFDRERFKYEYRIDVLREGIKKLEHNLSNAPKPRKRDAKGRYVKA